MWILIPLFLIALILATFGFLRLAAARRSKRSQWNDLRSRRDLIASQLRHLKDVQNQRPPLA